ATRSPLRLRVQHLFDPPKARDRGGEPASRDREKSHVADLLGGRAGSERTPRVGTDGALGLCAHGDPKLPEPAGPIVERSAGVGCGTEPVEGTGRFGELASEPLVDLGE